MKKALRRRAIAVAHRVLSALLALVFAASTVVGTAPMAFASDRASSESAAVNAAATGGGSQPATASILTSAPAPAVEPSPTVVRELEASRTALSSTYEMSDGSFQGVISQEPVHYLEDGAWKTIDPTLVPTASPDVVHTKASAYDMTIGSSDEATTPVTVTHGDWSFGVQLLGAEQSSVFALANSAGFPLAMTDTKLTYQTSGTSLKDTLVLSSKNAPDTFTFFVSLRNLSVYTDPTGGYALYDSHGKPAGNIAPLKVFDSAPQSDGTTGAVCAGAEMSVVGAPGGAYVTYKVPRSWLDDPARVWPVQVDPEVSWGGNSVSRDTYVASNHPGDNNWNSTCLDQGWDGTLHTVRPLIQFNLGTTIPQGATINYASMQLYCYSNTSGGSPTVHAYPITAPWTESANWYTTFGSGSWGYNANYDAGSTVSGTGYKYFWGMGPIVQKWYDGTIPNYGVVLKDNSDTSSGDTCRKFYSREKYSTWQAATPHLSVNWTVPTISGTFDKTSYKPGDTVTASVRISTKMASASTQVAAHILGKDASGAVVDRGRFQWTADGGFGFDPSYGDESEIQLDGGACSTAADANGRTVNFVYRIGEGYGDIQENHLWAYDDDWTSTYNSQSAMPPFIDTGASFSVTPAGIKTPSVVTTASVDWWNEADGRDDTATAGRGAVELTWQPVPFATSYKVYLFDGNTYRLVGSTTATSWATAGKGLYPTDTAISNLSTGTTANPFLSGTGLDLRDDPRALYAKTTGRSTDLDPNYYFKVAGVNRAGEAAAADNASATVALENRTVRLSDDIRYPAYDLGSMYGDDASVRFDKGALTLDAVDLKLPGNGPTAGLSRHYDSSLTTATTFAPGWRFDFEERIDKPSDNTAVHTDVDGDRHVYRYDGTKWVAPNGCFDRLSYDSSEGWTLAHKDLSKTKFNTDGQLSKVVDNCGNAVTYEWPGNDVVIKAPGDGLTLKRRITVSRDSSGVVTQARLEAKHTLLPEDGDADLTVDYNSQGDQARVTAHPGQPEQQITEYRYSDGKIVAVAVPGFQPSDHGEAVWEIGYGSTGTTMTVSNETGAGTPRIARSLSWDAQGRTATASVAGIPQVFKWNPNGTVLSNSSEGSTTALWTHGYDVALNEVRSSTPTGTATGANFDGRGNMTCGVDEMGRVTTLRYNDLDEAVEQRDPSGSITWTEYDPATGNRLNQEQLLDTSGKKSRSEWQYDSTGRLTLERTKIDDATWAETSYTEYQDCGSPKYVSALGVRLSSGVASDTITVTRTYDQLGNVKSETDSLNNTSRTEYDRLGRPWKSTDPTGTVTNYAYSELGGISEAKTSNPNTGTVTNWKSSEYNGAGLLTTETVKGSGGNAVTTGTHRYDAAGRETTVTDSSVAGPEVTQYDAQGQEVAYWEAGSDTSSTATAERTTYNADGEILTETDAGAVSAADTATLNPDGSVASETGADGTVTSYTYDAAGNVASETEMSDVGSSTIKYETNLAGDSTTEVDAEGVSHTTEYNLAGDPISTGSGAQNPSTDLRNTLGWVLRQTDFDGIVTENVYDKNGRVITNSVTATGTAPMVTTNVYDEAGRVLSTSNPDGSRVEMEYDCFGRIVVERHFDTTGAEAKRVRTTYDEAGRSSHIEDEITGATSDTTFGQAGASTITTSRRSGSAVTTSVVDGTGLLRSQFSTFAGTGLDWAVVATDTAGRVIDATSTVLDTDWNVRYDEAGRPVWNGGNGAAPQGTTSVYVAEGTTATRTAEGTQTISHPCSVPVRGVVSVGSTSTLTYEYDKDTGKKTNDNFAFGIGGTEHNAYSYDISGNLATATVGGRTKVYSYDKTTGSVKSIENVLGDGPHPAYEVRSVGFTYAPVTGRLASRTETALSGEATRNYEHDAFGHRTSEAPSTGATDTVYTWSGNRLTSYTGRAGQASYVYDTDGQRLRSVVTINSVVTTTTFDYQGIGLLGLSAQSSDGSTHTLDYMYDEKGVVFAGVYAGSDATPGVRFLMSTTERGDVRELMDASGNAFAFYSYDAWGNPLRTVTQGTSLVTEAQAASIAARQPLRYASYAYDAESGLYYLSQRYYDPSTMQFISKDPARADGEMSAYMYCGDDPVNNVDPEGLWGWGSIWGAVKKVVRAVVHTVYHAARTVARAVLPKPLYRAAAKAYHAAKKKAKAVYRAVTHRSSYRSSSSSHTSWRSSHNQKRPSAKPKKRTYQVAGKPVNRNCHGGPTPSNNLPQANPEDVAWLIADVVSTAAMAFPPVGAGARVAVTAGKAARIARAAEGTGRAWRVGDSITKATTKGKPVWSTVRSRYWKNEAFENADKYGVENIARMRKGKAPIGQDGYSMHLHHKVPRSQDGGHEIGNLEAMTQTDHYALHYGQ